MPTAETSAAVKQVNNLSSGKITDAADQSK